MPKIADWDGFRAELAQIRDKPRKSKAGRKPFDVLLRFKVLVLQQMYNLGDDQTEYQIQRSTPELDICILIKWVFLPFHLLVRS